MKSTMFKDIFLALNGKAPRRNKMILVGKSMLFPVVAK
jgi:hypothetical protein